MDPQAMSVVEMVSTQASSSPAAIALAAASEAVSYAELDRRSNQLARYLKSFGVGTDQPVGLSMERSPAMVIAALAILKAGGAYLPLDSTLPSERLTFMLRDAAVQVVVTGDASAAKIPSGDWRSVHVNEEADKIGVLPPDRFLCPVTPQNLAYVIYTSGSTGEPKGVEATHGGLANLISWHCRAFNVTSKDRASHQAAVAFDAAVWEIWPYLAAGASVHIPPESCRTNPEALRDWLVEEHISITFLATPLAERMMLLPWPEQTTLRILLTGADTLHRRPAPDLPFALINNYGPTECTVVATSGRVECRDGAIKDSAKMALPPIGRPIDNTQIFIVDERMQEVPAGTTGELCISGAGLARGYRNRTDLTQQKFVTNPFRSEENVSCGERIYRTGDLARLMPNGEIEFLGRMDEQIKIRGFRIEPNEIVAVLDEHPAVSASAVASREGRDDEKALVAYVVLSAETKVTGAELREHLRKRLPDYMIPGAYVRMESLPLTANGKVDLAALPAPSESNRLSEDAFAPPTGVVQERLAGIIGSLLHADRIGAHDNFFLLGGHSLLGTQLIARVNEAFGVELPLLQIFDHPTLAEMSEVIETLILAKLGEASASEPRPDHADKTLA
jgi:amino acid adenylation domain-containing protein